MAPYRRDRAHRRSRLVGGRDPHGDRPGRGDGRRLGAGLHAEPAHVAADEPSAREPRAVQGAARRGRDRRRPLPRALPRQPREPEGRLLREVASRRCRTPSTSGARSRRTGSSSTSARTSAPAWTPGSKRVVEGDEEGARPLLGHDVAADGELAPARARRSGGRSKSWPLIFDRLGGHPRLGVCLDSCHLYASGYDVTDEAALDAIARRARRLDRPRPAARPARQRLGDAARLESRPAREHRRRADGREAERVPAPPEAPGPAGGARGARGGRARPERGRGPQGEEAARNHGPERRRQNGEPPGPPGSIEPCSNKTGPRGVRPRASLQFQPIRETRTCLSPGSCRLRVNSRRDAVSCSGGTSRFPGTPSTGPLRGQSATRSG